VLPSILGVLKDATGSYGVGFFLFAGMAGSCLLALRTVAGNWRVSWLRGLEPAAAEIEAD
jgi:hypothetical protein